MGWGSEGVKLVRNQNQNKNGRKNHKSIRENKSVTTNPEMAQEYVTWVVYAQESAQYLITLTVTRRTTMSLALTQDL